MGLKDFVQPGRVCFVNYGEDYGKMVVIVDIADTKRVLVDGMEKFPRVMYPLERLTLTKLRVPVLRGARTGKLIKAAKTYELEKKWIATKMQQKLARFSRRAELNDYERFQVMVARKQRSYALGPITFAALGGKKPAAKGKAPAKAPAKGKKK